MASGLAKVAARVLAAATGIERGRGVLGISLITNLAAGMTREKVDHHAVMAAAAAGDRMGSLLAQVLASL